MPRALVIGGSGQIGRYLVPQLLASAHAVLAVSRIPRSTRHAGLHWLQGDVFATLPALPELDMIFSLGPLDGFAAWLARTRLAGKPRIVAFGSMSASSKRDSPDPGERALALSLRQAEQALADAAAWAPRIKTGLEALVHSSLTGKGAMAAQQGVSLIMVMLIMVVVSMLGIGGVQIAHLLDHSDTQNVGIYTEDNIEQSLRIFEAMDEPMNLLADMFAGRIIRHESEAIRADDINSRKFKNDGKQIGNCGGSSACQNGIKACLICSGFQPLLGADWNELLEDLNQERLFQSKNGASELVLSSYDLPLANTAAIMEACNKILVDESYA